MRLENSFEVPAAPEQAWALLNDVPRVVPCLPGAELTRVVGEDSWEATLYVKLGPIALNFLADVIRRQADATERLVALSVKAREARGRGGATAQIESRLADIHGGTRVSIVTDLALQGVVAQYGRGVLAVVAEQLTSQFAECLSGLLEDGGAEPGTSAGAAEVEPVGGISLAVRALWRRLLRPLRRG